MNTVLTILTSAILLTMLLFPPFVSEEVETLGGRPEVVVVQTNAGYGFLFTPPDERARVDAVTLLVYCVIILSVWFITQTPMKTRHESAKNAV